MSIEAILGGGALAGGIALAESIKGKGSGYQTSMDTLGSELADASKFTGYSVKTGLGSSTVAPDGTLTLGVGPDAGMASAAQAGMTGALGAYGSGADMIAAGSTNPYASMALSGMQSAANPFLQQATGYINPTNNYMNQAANFMLGAHNPYASGGYQTVNQSLQGLGGLQGGALGASNEFMNRSLASTAQREQDIYNRAMAMQQPELDAARTQQQAAEFAGGRGGVMGSQFGGTGEDAAMARAQAQAQNKAAFDAMAMANQEQLSQASLANQYAQQGLAAAGQRAATGQGLFSMGSQSQQADLARAQALGNLGQADVQARLAAGQQLGAMGNQVYANQLAQAQAIAALGNQQAQLAQGGAGLFNQLGAGYAGLGNAAFTNQYLPMAQQLNALQVGANAADQAQTGQLTGTGYQAQLGLGGMQAAVNADKSAADLYAGLAQSTMSGLDEGGWLYELIK